MRRTVKLVRKLRVLALCSVALLADAANAETTVITADKMIDVLTGKTVDYPAVFVGEDGRITGVADARTVKWGSDVKHITSISMALPILVAIADWNSPTVSGA
jgi:hypothetical protein